MSPLYLEDKGHDSHPICYYRDVCIKWIITEGENPKQQLYCILLAESTAEVQGTEILGSEYACKHPQ